MVTIAAVTALVAASVSLACGCGTTTSGRGAKVSRPGVPGSSVAADGEEEALGGGEEEDGRTGDEANVERAAFDYAQESNTGSTFEVAEMKVVRGWARITLEETEVPEDEAVSFSVYLCKTDGQWDVVGTGSELSADDLPGAPEELFD